MFRPFVTLLLCSVCLLGHLPAWFHVAQCDDCAASDLCFLDGQSDFLGANALRPDKHIDVPGHCCCSDHACSESSVVDAPIDNDSANGRATKAPHDHSSCVICQSLAAPTGCLPVALDCDGELVLVAHWRPVAPSFDWVQQAFFPPPRGPPAAA